MEVESQLLVLNRVDMRRGDIGAATLVESFLDDAEADEASEQVRFGFRLAGDVVRPSGELLKEA